MQSLDRHNASKLHKIRASSDVVMKYRCDCGKSYLHLPSLRNHKMKCSSFAGVVEAVATKPPTTPSAAPSVATQSVATPSVTEIIEELKNTVLEERKINQLHQLEREQYQKEQAQIVNELRSQIAMLLDKHAGTSSTNCNNTNIETQQNITININSFGNENTDYIDDKAILACISKVYKSIPSLLEKIHFDPKHPENHNIKITNKKLPYASVMGNNQKWKTVDRKDAIETMILNGYNMLDEKYAENKEKISTSKQQNFEGFQTKFESEDKDMMKQIKTEVDMMVLNGGG
jgi:hypothetical protein